VAQILLPAIGALYYGLAQIWGLPRAGDVVGTIVVVDTFLGVFLKYDSTAYENSGQRYDGEVELFKEDGGLGARLVANRHLVDIADVPGKNSVDLKITRNGV